jgi:putative molybdopterin biosynthesis protein
VPDANVFLSPDLARARLFCFVALGYITKQMKRNIYLEDIPLDEAWQAFRNSLESHALWRPLGVETIPVVEANGRVTATAVWAKISSPHYHASAMDGYALRARDTAGATETSPIPLTLVDGEADVERVARPAQAVNTGNPLPVWANAVVMIEHTQQISVGDGRPGIEIRASLPPWHHVRPMGEDMVATELVLPANHKLRPVDLGALAGSGHGTVEVYIRPRVAIIPTGSELVAAEAAAKDAGARNAGGESLEPGQIIEYNSIVLAAQVADWGGIPTRWPIVPDEFQAIETAARDALEDTDLILLNAGSSAGSEDYTAHVVEKLGRLLVHGVAVRPGHPVILGLLDSEQASAVGEQHIPIIGVPGYPVSAALTGEIFVEPLLARWQGRPAHRPPTLTATLTRKLVSHTGDDDYVRVAVGKVGDEVKATPISRGAGVITSLVRADGIVRIPRFSEGADAGTQVTVHLYRHKHEIENTIVAIGSHDLTLDLLAQFLAEREGGVRLMSAHVGSLGGLVALRRGECHIAGSHLLDQETGDYNVSYVRQYLPDQEIVLVTLVGREQGWIVLPGNPKGVSDWGDAADPEVRIVNRQRGAGTRVLLDYQLSKLGIKPAQIRGYHREEYTHLAVAAAVASRTADAGLGIRAAARALKLDFVPLAHERYDLVIPKSYFESELLQPLLALLEDEGFKAAVSALPGYDVKPMGKVAALTS